MLKLSKLALAIALGTTSSLSQASEIDDLQKAAAIAETANAATAKQT